MDKNVLYALKMHFGIQQFMTVKNVNSDRFTTLQLKLVNAVNELTLQVQSVLNVTCLNILICKKCNVFLVLKIKFIIFCKRDVFLALLIIQYSTERSVWPAHQINFGINKNQSVKIVARADSLIHKVNNANVQKLSFGLENNVYSVIFQNTLIYLLKNVYIVPPIKFMIYHKKGVLIAHNKNLSLMWLNAFHALKISSITDNYKHASIVSRIKSLIKQKNLVLALHHLLSGMI